MKQSVVILLITGVCAIVALLLASSGGFREDFASAIGGVVGFAIANGAVVPLRGSRVDNVSDDGNSEATRSPGLNCTCAVLYTVFAIVFFSLIGWLTGYVHKHGEFAGTVCGGLGGFLLAMIVPAIHRSSFMSTGRQFQIATSIGAFVTMLGIVWVMYEHEIR